jgi:hypothetical protein
MLVQQKSSWIENAAGLQSLMAGVESFFVPRVLPYLNYLLNYIEAEVV